MPIKNKSIFPFKKKLEHCEDVVVAFMHTRKENIKKQSLYDFRERIKKMEEAEKEGRHYDYSFFYRNN